MRLFFGLLLFLIAVASIIAGGIFWPLVLGAAALMGGEEYIAITKARGMNPSVRIIRGMIIAFFVVAALPNVPGLSLPPNFALQHFPILLTCGFCISFIRLLFRHEKSPATIADIAATIMGFIYIGWMPSHLVLLRDLLPPGTVAPASYFLHPGVAYVLVSLSIVWATDVFAYYVGKNFGKHLLCPQISPKKTVEGALGGFFASIVIAYLFVYLFDNFIFVSHPFAHKLWQVPLMAAVISIAGQLGDLGESLLKRDAGVKDSGVSIPGHGGFLDRGDSLLFASAISYYWISMVVLGIL